MSLSERTYAQRVQDDEDHRLALCGLSFDARAEDELEDFNSRHSDFIFASGLPSTQPPQTRSGGRRGRSSVTPERMPAATLLSTA